MIRTDVFESLHQPIELKESVYFLSLFDLQSLLHFIFNILHFTFPVPQVFQLIPLTQRTPRIHRELRGFSSNESFNSHKKDTEEFLYEAEKLLI